MQPQLDLAAPDWKQILLDFRRWGWTMYAVAQAIDEPTSTVIGWLNTSREPSFGRGTKLLALYRQESEKRNCDGPPAAPDVQPVREDKPMKTRKPRTVRQPGEEPAAPDVQPEAGESNVDEAIAAAQQGKARVIKKPRAPVAPSPIKGDPERPPEAAVNAKREMSYADAMKLYEAGKLTHATLTECGWVPRNPTEAELRAAKR